MSGARGRSVVRYVRQGERGAGLPRYIVLERATGAVLGLVVREDRPGRYYGTRTTWWSATSPDGELRGFSRARWDAARYLAPA